MEARPTTVTSGSAAFAAELPDRMQVFYRSIAVERHAALERLDTIFAPEIAFWDPFRETNGIDALKRVFEDWLDRYSTVGFSEFRCHGSGEYFAMTYEMHMRMAVGPMFKTPMVSVCHARDGLLVELRDYYDLASGIASPSTLLLRAYRGVVNKWFL
jgi:ketosteroid isomerase-like protein